MSDVREIPATEEAEPLLEVLNRAADSLAVRGIGYEADNIRAATAHLRAIFFRQPKPKKAKAEVSEEVEMALNRIHAFANVAESEGWESTPREIRQALDTLKRALGIGIGG
jgi:hypothetical protein